LVIAGFLKLVVEALNAAGVEYLIGGAITEWPWGEPRNPGFGHYRQYPNQICQQAFQRVEKAGYA